MRARLREMMRWAKQPQKCHGNIKPLDRLLRPYGGMGTRLLVNEQMGKNELGSAR